MSTPVVVVIGGRPGGSTGATLLAQQGLKAGCNTGVDRMRRWCASKVDRFVTNLRV